MAFIAMTPAEIAPDQPVSTTLLQKVKDNFDDHENRISVTAGVIGEILNGSFETPQGGNPNWPDKWAIGQYAGGSVLLDRDTCHGKYSLKMVHSVAGGGGGYAETDYVGMSMLYIAPLNFAYKVTAAAMAIEVWARFYAADANGNPSTYLGEKRLYSNTTDNPLFWSSVQVADIPIEFPSARYVKYRLVGGASGSSTTGSVWFDGVGASIRTMRSYLVPTPFTTNPSQLYLYGYQQWMNFGSAENVTVASGYRWLVLPNWKLQGATDEWGYNYPSSLRFYLNGVAGKYSSVLTAPGVSQVSGDIAYDLSGVAPGTYACQLQYYSQAGGPSVRGTAGYLNNGVVLANAFSGTYTITHNNVPLY